MVKFLSILVLLFFACKKESSDNLNQNRVQLKTPYSYINNDNVGCPYDIVIIDSCEYIHVRNGNATWGSHKGNCKFCAERSKYKGEGPI